MMRQYIETVQEKPQGGWVGGGTREGRRPVERVAGLFTMVTEVATVGCDNPILVEIIDLSHLRAA